MRRLSRRALLRSATGLALGAPAISLANGRPILSHGLQSGEASQSSAMIWARADRPCRALVELSTTERFIDPVRLAPVDVLPSGDLVMKRRLTGLPLGQEIFYRVVFEDLSGSRARSSPAVGRLRTAPASLRKIRFVWSGDTCGQGWGIDESQGGMATYAAMAKVEPDFFIHCGDTIYADGPIAPTQRMPDGGLWKNLVAEGVHKVAETLEEFRGRFKYNLLDPRVRAFNAQVPALVQWDDHEVVNNWSDAKRLEDDPRYSVKDVPLLRARASLAFHQMTPISFSQEEPGRVYRRIAYGPLLDVFLIDLRSYRGPNGPSLERRLDDKARIFGEAQLAWLKRALLASRATWKVIATDMPLGLIVWDDYKSKSGAEAIANGDHGAPRGRELELAELLRFMKAARIENVVWLTADVHYTAAHYYDPSKARFSDFSPFWEFVSGPLHAGTFGPNALDRTFGPIVKFMKVPAKQNLPPSAGLQFFGQVDIEEGGQVMTVRLMNRAGQELYAVALTARD